jgi:hypothetical protein
MLRSYQRISPGPRHLETFRNNRKIFTVRVCRPHARPQAGGPPLVGCQRLLIQYIRSYPPHPEDFPPSANWGRAMPWWQETHLTWNMTNIRHYFHSLNVIYFSIVFTKFKFSVKNKMDAVNLRQPFLIWMRYYKVLYTCELNVFFEGVNGLHWSWNSSETCYMVIIFRKNIKAENVLSFSRDTSSLSRQFF